MSIPHLSRRVASAVVWLLAACVDRTAPEIIVLPSSFGIEAADSLWMACVSPDAQQDSAFHFVSSTSTLELGPGDSASVHVWIQDGDIDLSAPRRCQGTSASERGRQRTGIFEATSAGAAFVWDMIAVPDTAGGWVTSEEVSLGAAFRPTSGEAWDAVLILEGQTLPVLLHPH